MPEPTYLHKKVSLSNHKLLAEKFKWLPKGCLENATTTQFEQKQVNNKFFCTQVVQSLLRAELTKGMIPSPDHLFYNFGDYAADPRAGCFKRRYNLSSILLQTDLCSSKSLDYYLEDKTGNTKNWPTLCWQQLQVSRSSQQRQVGGKAVNLSKKSMSYRYNFKCANFLYPICVPTDLHLRIGDVVT